jgi:DNA-binding LytR/AlgR family response regulator
MKIIIIEDELLAQQKLESMLSSRGDNYEIVAKLGSVKESLHWFRHNPPPDLAFVDIQLSDDQSFEIFRQHPADFPVIFTTAFDKYILESLEFNSIDYLLKPITEEKLHRALAKIAVLEQHFVKGNVLRFVQQMNTPKNSSRIIAKRGTEYHVLELQDIAYFFTEHKVVFVRDHGGRQLMLDGTLGDWQEKVDRNMFFRINRKYLASVKSIEKFKPDNGKIHVYLKPEMNEEIYVSKESAPAFREWIQGAM